MFLDHDPWLLLDCTRQLLPVAHNTEADRTGANSRLDDERKSAFLDQRVFVAPADRTEHIRGPVRERTRRSAICRWQSTPPAAS